MFSSMMNSSIEEGEFFPTYIARMQALATTRFVPGGWLLPSGLAALIDKFRPYVGSYERVLSEHMFASLFKRCMSDAEYSRYISHLLYEPAGGMASVIGQSGPSSGWNRAVLAFCPECIDANKTDGNQSFFNRENMLPGLLVCGKHAVDLVTVCGKCNADEKRFMANPRMNCGCRFRRLAGESKLSEGEMAMEIEVSNAVSCLLNPAYLPGLNQTALGTFVRSVLINRGLLDGNQFDWPRLVALFSESRWGYLISRTNYLVSRDSSQFKNFFLGRGSFRHPIHIILSMLVVFGSWSGFEEYFLKFDLNDYVEQPSNSERAANPVRRKYKISAANRYIIKYGGYRDEFPDETHEQILSRFARSIAQGFLSRNKILEYGISLARSEKEDCKIDEYYSELDLSYSLHVRDARRYLLSFDCKYKISQLALLRGHRMQKAYFGIKDKLPLTVAALKECAENTEEFRARMTRISKGG